MALQKTKTISAEVDASAAIEEAIENSIEEGIVRRGVQAKRKVRRARVARWSNRLLFLLSLVFFGLAAQLDSKPYAMAATVMLLLSGGIALMRLGGDVSVQEKGKQAGETAGVRSIR
ncbi:MAG: hypothetical protein ACI9KE_004877 [Polyangiales bacterium]|jgi:hypothetical protein